MKVLCGIGGSDDSFRALDRTVERAAVANDDLTVAVVDNEDSSVAPDDVMERAQEAVDDAGIDADVRRVGGDPEAGSWRSPRQRDLRRSFSVEVTRARWGRSRLGRSPSLSC